MGQMVEVDEDVLVALRNRNALLDKTLTNPKTRETLLRSIKSANPELPIPELDAAQPLNDALGEMSKTMADMRKQMADDKQAREDEKRMDQLRAEWAKSQSKAMKAGYVGESLEALEKFMEEKGVADHEIAMPAFERLHPPASPVASNSGHFDFFATQRADDVVNNKLGELREGKVSSDQFLNDSVGQILRDIRGAA